jgi:hypothetical protein
LLPFTLSAPGEDEVGPSTVRSVSYRIHGVARIEGSTLVLEWTGEKLIDEVKGPEVRSRSEPVPARRVAVAAGSIGGAEVRGWLRRRLELWSSDINALAGVPGARGGRIRLRISRSDQLLAEELVASLQMAAADAALDSAYEPPPLP